MDNQKAYEYINSEVIREHLIKLDYQLTPVQCAFLVWQSQRHTLNEKHEAWNDIIRTLPDCPVEKRMNCAGWDSLHDMLRGYMTFEEKCLSMFRDEESDVFYEYEVFEQVPTFVVPDGGKYDWRSGNRHFRSLESCYRVAMDDAAEEHCRFRVTKHYMDALSTDSEIEPYITVNYNSAGDVLDFYLNGSSFFSLTEEEDDLWSCSFDGMWFDIPIPFEKGDIVCDNTNIYTAGVPFVLLGTVPWFKKEHPPKHGEYYSDFSDMDAYGYSYDRESLFFSDDFRAEYLNLEYYAKPLLGAERLLYSYSQFEKGQIDAYTILKLYRMLMTEELSERERRSLCYLPEAIKSPIFQTRQKKGAVMDNQRICELVNSKDVRKYLADINYQFSPAEAAWLAARCERLTLEERHKVWREIMDTMPDCRLESVHFFSQGGAYDSMRDVLRKIMEIGQRNLSEFYREDGKAVYQHAIICRDYANYDRYDNSPLFSRYADCLTDLKNELSEADGDEMFRITIRKNYIDHPEQNLELDLSFACDIIDVCRCISQDDEESDNKRQTIIYGGHCALFCRSKYERAGCRHIVF